MIEIAADAESTLLAGMAAGDPSSTRALLDATASTVYGFIFARVGGRRDVAEDLAQATYLEAMKSAKSYRGDAALETWLCAIARRQVVRHYEAERKRQRLERKLQLVTSDSDVEEEPHERAFAESEAMIAALGRLAPLHRQVLVFKYLDGLSVDQIASELRRSKVQIQSLLQRARAGLRQELEEDPDA
jgi:RNA polymerase sigma-70 factor, ECF subfamily